MAPISEASLMPAYNLAIAEEGSMAKVQLMLKKLKSSMESLKDFDDLEKAGMAKKDVDRMRRAMNEKIKRMTGDTIDLIHAL